MASFDHFRVVPVAQPDTTPPVSSIEVTDTDPVVIALSAVDGEGGSGVARIEYRIGVQEWSTYTEPISVPRQSTARSIDYRAIDAAGNVEVFKAAEIPASVVVDAPAEVTVATTCIGGKAVLTVRLRSTATAPTTFQVTTPVGSKTFAAVAPKALSAHNFTDGGKTLAAGTVTISADNGTGPGSAGTKQMPFAARSCA